MAKAEATVDELTLPRLFHGSSTHYLSRFRVGACHQEWVDKTKAFKLRDAVRDAVARSSIPLKFYERNILEQRSYSANWQHGELYATPSLWKAIEYAVDNAARGGELLTVLRAVVDRIAESNRGVAEDVDRFARSLGLDHFVSGSARPIIVALDGVTIEDVTTEDGTSPDRQARRLNELLNKPHYEAMCQVMNFRIRPRAGIISDIGSVVSEADGSLVARWSS